jgi:hypothetical protein
MCLIKITHSGGQTLLHAFLLALCYNFAGQQSWPWQHGTVNGPFHVAAYSLSCALPDAGRIWLKNVADLN